MATARSASRDRRGYRSNDKDFGAGYSYRVLIEDATFKLDERPLARRLAYRGGCRLAGQARAAEGVGPSRRRSMTFNGGAQVNQLRQVEHAASGSPMSIGAW